LFLPACFEDEPHALSAKTPAVKIPNNPINLQMEILDILINYGANPLQVNEANMTPIDNYLILHPALSSTAFSKVIDTQKYEKVKNSMM